MAAHTFQEPPTDKLDCVPIIRQLPTFTTEANISYYCHCYEAPNIPRNFCSNNKRNKAPSQGPQNEIGMTKIRKMGLRERE